MLANFQHPPGAESPLLHSMNLSLHESLPSPQARQRALSEGNSIWGRIDLLPIEMAELIGTTSIVARPQSAETRQEPCGSLRGQHEMTEWLPTIQQPRH